MKSKIKESSLFWPAYFKKDILFVIDETLIPEKVKYIEVKTPLQAVKVIKDMKTRAFGQFLVVLSTFLLVLKKDKKIEDRRLMIELKKTASALNKSRPTFPFSEVTGMVLGWAQKAQKENLNLRGYLEKNIQGFLLGIRGRRLGRVEKLAETLMNHKNVLTHCNVSGELAMAAQICKEQGKNISFFATETRPYFQGSRLTAWELKKAKIPVTLVADNAVGTLLRDKMIDAVVVGSDRSCANGDFANKIGTLQIAVMAKEFGVPFYVLTQPSNKVKQGKDIPIEIRDENELLKVKGKCFAHKGVKGFYPGFDVVPRQFITKAIAINVNPATKGNASSELNPKERVKPESVQIARKQSFSLGPAEKKNSIILLHGVFKDSFFEILKKKKIREVFVLEGRPYLDGAKELCPKLLKHKIQPVLIADNMAGFLFYKDLVKEVWISYQEESKKNVLCKIGGLILSVMAKHHKVPINVFPSGKQKKYIANPKEIFSFNGERVAAKGIDGFVPLLEDIPRKYITEIYS